MDPIDQWSTRRVFSIKLKKKNPTAKSSYRKYFTILLDLFNIFLFNFSLSLSLSTLFTSCLREFNFNLTLDLFPLENEFQIELKESIQ